MSGRLTGAGVTGVVALGLLVSGCAQTPMGPTVQVMPGPGKSFEAFTYDQGGCRQYAEGSVAGQAQNANNRAVGAAALTTVLGAGLGAAIGGGRGAGIGAASGALGGAGIGASGSSNAQYGIQQQYDNAFAQCMYAKGNMVPGYGPMMVNAPPPPPPYASGPDMDLTRAVQIQLIRLGYMRGPADGVSGPQTSAAISQFESVSGLPVDGVPSPPLLGRLQQTP
ncbi:MAG: peptidoglycan-binding domain-containing protein [Acetobacteraceae bacterium]